MTYRVTYRDKRRPTLGLLLVSVAAENARRAAAKARERLAANGCHPIILGVREAR